MRLTFAVLVRKVLSSKTFRRELRRNPRRALEQRGYTVTPAILRSLRAFNWRSAENVARAFHPRKAKRFIT